MSTTNYNGHDVFLAFHVVIVVLSLCDLGDPAFLVQTLGKFYLPRWSI